MKRREPTRTDLAIIKVIASIRSCETYQQLQSCKTLVKILYANYDVRYTTVKYIRLRYKQQLQIINY